MRESLIVAMLACGAAAQASEFFVEADRLPFDGTLQGLVVADFNGDGLDDVAAMFRRFVSGAPQIGGVALFLQNESGELAFEYERIAMAQYLDIEVADFDGDGRSEIVVSAIRTSDASPDDETGILIFQTSTNGFDPPIRLSERPGSIEIADLDGDGRPDVLRTERGHVATSPEPFVTPGFIETLFIDDAMNATAIAIPGQPTHPSDVRLGDFDGDGILDVLLHQKNVSTPAAFPNVTERFLIRRGLGGGGFGQAAAELPFKPVMLLGHVPDFTGDGRSDLLVEEDFQHQTFIIGDNFEFESGPVFDAMGSAPVSWADLNGDGFADLIGATDYEGIVASHLGQGDGSFRRGLLHTIGWSPSETQAIRLADDEFPGVIGIVVDGIGLAHGIGASRYAAPHVLPSLDRFPFHSVFRPEPPFADIDGDGKQEMLVHRAVGPCCPPVVWIMEVSSDRLTLERSVRLPPFEGFSGQNGAIVSKLADKDGDGDVDAFILDHMGFSTWRLSVVENENGKFGDVQIVVPPTPSSVQRQPELLVADINGDDRADIVLGDATGTHRLLTYLAGPTGAYGQPIASHIHDAIGAGSSPRVIPYGPADFNDDGLLDVATWSTSAGGRIDILLSNGDGTFKSSVTARALDSVGLITDDINGDGAVDLIQIRSIGPGIVTESGGGSTHIGRRLGDGAGGIGPLEDMLEIPKANTDLDFLDVDGDGVKDIVITFGQLDLTVNLGLGGGIFDETPIKLTGGPFVEQSLFMDVDSDGDDDIVAIGFSKVVVHESRVHKSVAGDLNDDGRVDALDIALLLGQWGLGGAADFDEDGVVNSRDLRFVLDHVSR